MRGVYRETSSFSIIYAGKIAFFTFGHFVGSNFEKPRPVKSRVRFMYEMPHFVHNFPLTRERVYRTTSSFSVIYAGKIAFFTFGHFVGSNFEKPRTSQESVLCTKCSISYIISRWPVNRVYWETSWFSIIYAGKIAFFTFGRFVGSNFEKPRTRQESVLCTKCSISYLISHRPVRGVYRETSSFSVIYAGKIVFFTFGNFVGSRVKSPFYVRNAAFRT